MADLVALAATPGAFAPGSVLHLWHNGTTLCDSWQFIEGAQARRRHAVAVYEWPGVVDPRPLCGSCRRTLDRCVYLADLHTRLGDAWIDTHYPKETDRG